MTPDEPRDTPPAPAARALRCPNDGREVERGGRGVGRIFCEPACQIAFTNRQKGRGAVLAPLVLAWLETRHAPAGTEEAQICRDARREITAIGRSFREEDRAAGRPPASVYAALLMRPPDFHDRETIRPYVDRAPLMWLDRGKRGARRTNT